MQRHGDPRQQSQPRSQTQSERKKGEPGDVDSEALGREQAGWGEGGAAEAEGEEGSPRPGHGSGVAAGRCWRHC